MTAVQEDLARRIEELERELAEARLQQAEALAYQTASSDVLGVISRSPNRLQPVFDAIVESGLKLFPGAAILITRPDRDLIKAVAVAASDPARAEDIKRTFPVPLTRAYMNGIAILDRKLVEISDGRCVPAELAPGAQAFLASGNRAITIVPIMRDDRAIGALNVLRLAPGPLSKQQLELLRTFANQAVIAIENTRLFEEVQGRTRELQESLEYQTATSEVLGVISRSPTDVQPVFDTIAESAARLCKAQFCHVFRFDGKLLHFAAVHGLTPEGREALRSLYPMPPGRATAAARSILSRTVEEIPDVRADSYYSVAHSLVIGFRSVAAVPMLKDGHPIGAVAVMRSQTGHFPEREIQLLKTFADQAVIAIENTRLFEAEQARTAELQARSAELSQSLEYQTAISNVLSVISRSPGELQPVLNEISSTAANLCEANNSIIMLEKADELHLVAAHDYSITVERGPIDRGWTAGRAFIDRKPVHVHDLLAVRDEFPLGHERALRSGHRTTLGIPLLREGKAIGCLFLGRTVMRPFTEKQIALLQTFADQAVIAIENTRLFEEVQARTRELAEALEQQTATSEVLGAISRSKFELQPVLDTLVASAAHLCDAPMVAIHVQRDASLPGRARHGFPAEMMEALSKIGQVMDRGSLAGRTIAAGKPVHIPDVEADTEYTFRDFTRITGTRSMLGVPLLRDGRPVGLLSLYRTRVAPFAPKQIELMATFADQAVIAIENARLFEEVQARTRELTQSLEYQTATSEVLGVISRSPSELQPVLDSIAETASRLCQADFAYIYRLDGDQYRLAAINSSEADYVNWLMDHPISPSRGTLVGRVSLEKQTVHIPDNASDPEYTWRESRERGGFRTMLGVPLILDDIVVGVVALVRRIVQPFSEKQIELVTTFANQAVIAVNNVRLFEQVQARNRDLTALGEVGRAVSLTLDLKVVLKTIVDRAVELSGTDAGSIFYYRQETGRFELGETSGLDDEEVARFRKLDIAVGQTGLAEAIANRQPLQVPDVVKRPSNALRDAALEAGLRAALIVPLLGSEGALGALVLQRRLTGKFSPSVVSLMQSFADQSAIALENARLFEEIARKSRELEIASQHKSQFVANMSHELRTPLAAILGYAELMQEGFYEPQGSKSLDALTRIRSNGKHLLGLINTVLDIAKIESGQFSLNMAEYAIDSMVETVRAATESLAQNKKLTLKTEVVKSLPIGLGDEQRLTQVLLNLVGNAIKFTDAGEVRITARTENGHFALSVADTGPGIALEEQKRIFDQFHQIDNSNTKAKGGTGLGLAIAKQIVEMHGGRIWVESTVGKGSTFRMEVPTRAEFRKSAT